MGKRARNKLIIAIVTLIVTILAAALSKSTNPKNPIIPSDTLIVSRVIDGDTVELNNGQTVRYIGIDTPESTIKNECFGNESANKNKELVEGKEVRLEKDVSETDKFGRLLRYVYVGNNFINETLVKEGFANAITYPPDVKYQDKFLLAQKEARDANRGLWSKCIGSTVEGTSSEFIDKDCSDFKTQEEAQVFFVSEGGPANDSHNLDSDKDGNVCTSLP